MLTYISSFLVPSQPGRDHSGHARDDGLLIRRLAAPTTPFPLLLLAKI